MVYLLDANVFIESKNRHYGFDFCPAFWDWLDAQNHAGQVYSVERVADELKKKADALSTWAAARSSTFFLPLDGKVLSVAMPRVSTWVTSQSYKEAVINEFLQKADYYLIAHALAHGHVVVTLEIWSNSLKKVKIPNVCAGLNIKCITPYTMLRRENARFVLEP